MRIVIITLLFIHGICHWVGFMVPWGFVAPRGGRVRTTLLSDSIEVGLNGARALGIGWLLIAGAFLALASGLILRSTWCTTLAPIAVVASIIFCVLGWPDTKLGLLANLVITATLFAGIQYSWISTK